MPSPSVFIRRTHMYLALAFFPWMLMYALSTFVMNHRAYFTGEAGPAGYERERELVYHGVFPENADLRTISSQILVSTGLDGSHGVNRRQDGAIVITRNDLLAPRRLTYEPSTRTLLIEKMPHHTNAFLERFHRRRGYQTGYALDTLWAVSVDLIIAAMIVWALSGLWMWWEMKATRLLGAAAIAGGTGLFVFYLLTL
jgi:hypothetical protein